MPQVGDTVAGKYVIEQLIGIGGMGAVFAANHRFTGKRVALKWMLPELARDADAVARFMREAHAAGRINHPNVVDIYDVGEEGESYFLVMEYLHGEPLTSPLARRELAPTELLQLLLPAMRGVAAAHRQGVVHRDLKPDNIFLAYEEEGFTRSAKVLDFGISKVSNEGQVNPRLTKTGAVVGTPYYMSPEQIRGSSTLDKRADVYAFGVILYEALTGQVPFHADTYGALVLEIATGTPKAPRELVPDLDPELSRIVLRAMARDPAARYQDMESLVHALEPFAGGPRTATGLVQPLQQPLEATRVSPPQVATVPQLASTPFASEAPEVPRKYPVPGWLLFAGAAVVIVVAVWYATRPPEPPPLAPLQPLNEAGSTTKTTAAQPPPVQLPPRTPPAAMPPVVTSTPQPTLQPTIVAQPGATRPLSPSSFVPEREAARAADKSQPDQAQRAESEKTRHSRSASSHASWRNRSSRHRSARAHGRSSTAAARAETPNASELQVPPEPESLPHGPARSGTLRVDEF